LAAVAQVSFVTPAGATASSQPELAGFLERGQKLETERRWGEALTVYEDALRQYPRDPSLEERFSIARVHYDLGRRYSDVSFRDALATMPVQQALDLYSEVLLKIQSHYVHTPDWKQLVEHGTKSLEIALLDPVYIEHNLGGMAPARVERFRRELRLRLANRMDASAVTTRQAARDMAALAGQIGREQLGLKESAVVLEYVCGATNSLDPYSTFLTSGQLNEVYSQIEGNFVGLGVELKASEGSLLIVKVITGSPAERSGIRAQDRIIAVDGRTTKELSTDQAANMLQGREGTYVTVTAVSPGAAPRNIRVRREQVEVPSIDNARIIDAAFGIAYLKLTCFQKTTSRDLDTALWKLHRDGMKSLIIDLRGNPGGLLTTSVDVVDKFVSAGTIVSTRGRSPQEDYNYSAHDAGTWQVPLVVLIDGDSASASEIFAGAIRDHRRGTLVGARSYGKGSVQGIFPLNISNAGLRLTTAKFYSPNGHPYSQVGVTPDVVVQQTAKPVDNGTQVAADYDAALEAAQGVAKRQMARR
jgi:carboxyl-terminal processing protease